MKRLSARPASAWRSTVLPATSFRCLMRPAPVCSKRLHHQLASAQQTPAVPAGLWEDEFSVLNDRHASLAPLPLPALAPSLTNGTGAARVVLVRHGQSTWNAEGRIQGSSNFSVLSAKGQRQAQEAHDALRGEHFDALVYSPLARAAETARVVWGERAHPTRALAALREIDLYSFQGLVKAEGKARFGDQYRMWQQQPAAFELDGHAPIRELWYRASLAWHDILAPRPAEPVPGSSGSMAAVGGAATGVSSAVAAADASRSSVLGGPHGTTLVVAHNAVNQALLCTALGLPPSHFRRLLQRNAAVSTLTFEPPPHGGNSGSGAGAPTATLQCLNRSPGSPLAVKADDVALRGVVVLIACGEAGEGPAASATAVAQLLSPLQVHRWLAPGHTPALALAERLAGDHFAVRAGQAVPPAVAPAVQALSLGLPRDAAEAGQALQQAWLDVVRALAADGGGPGHVHLAVVASPAQLSGLLWCCLDFPDRGGKQALSGRHTFRLDPGSVSVLEFAGDPQTTPCVLRCVNNVAHLAPQQLPGAPPL